MNNTNLGIKLYQEYLGARYKTLSYAFETFLSIGGKTIVELGTSRSFVSAEFEGCMANDLIYWEPENPSRWDWGAGLFTKMCAMSLQMYRPHIHSVDISADAIEISKAILDEHLGMITYHLMSSEEFLNSFSGKIDLLYMDAGETGAGAEYLHLREAEILISRKLLSERALILIDDVNIPGTSASKGKYSVPYFCKQGFDIIISDYQTLLQKTSTGSGSKDSLKA